MTLTGFFQVRGAQWRKTQAEFHEAARDRAESVIQGLQSGFEDVLILRGFMTSMGEVSRPQFDAFAAPILALHPFVKAIQWLPAVEPGVRPRLEAEGRRFRSDFHFFARDASGKEVPMPAGGTFYAVQYLCPYPGNEAALGYSATNLPTRQEAVAEALRTQGLAASGRVRLIQETGEQAGILVMAAVRDRDGHPRGLVQGVFRAGELVQKAIAPLEPRGVELDLLDASAEDAEALLDHESSPLPVLADGPVSTLHYQRDFSLAGRKWLVRVAPTRGYYGTSVGWLAWSVLLGGMGFTLLLTGYVRALLMGRAQVEEKVLARTQELAQEMESHRLDAQALRESEARYRQLVEVMGEGMWVLDTNGLTTFVNGRMARMLGYEPAEMIGRPVLEFAFEQDRPAFLQSLERSLEGLDVKVDTRFRRKDGSELWAIVTSDPVRDKAGKVVSLLGMVADITERRRAERLQLQGQKLESLGVLAGGIAHDFNNLLTAMLGNVNLAQMCIPPVSPARSYLENMEKAVQRASALTRQMLAYSGKGRFVVAPMDLNHLVEEMSGLLSISISKKVTLRYQLQADLPRIMAEASQVQQVVMNLVTNAAEAIGEGEGLVAVRTSVQAYTAQELARDFQGQAMAAGTYAVLEVSDTGQGMSPEVQARIFEPFFTTKFTGRGLGLSAMQGIVRGHRGGIRVYSEVGKGTTFKVIFPATSAEAAGPDEAPDLAEGWRGSGLVMVVDDEEQVRRVSESLLRSMGFEVIQAADGQEAVNLFRTSPEPIRAVLMDLTMPRMDGAEAFRELRRLDPTCRVVLTSGYNEQEAIHEFLGKGLAAFIQKPFQRESLMNALRKALES